MRLALSGWLAGAIALSAQIWTGAGPDDQWTTPGNWNPSVPVNDGSANILFAGELRSNSVITVPWEVRSIGFDPSASSFVVSGAAVGIGTSGLYNLSTRSQSLRVGVTLRAPQTWAAENGPLLVSGPVTVGVHTLTLSGPQPIDLTGAVAGSGRISKQGPGMLTLGGSIENTLTGAVTVAGGELRLAKVSGVNAIAGNLILGGSLEPARVRLEANDQISDVAIVAVAGLGEWDLNGHSEMIGGLQLSAGRVAMGAGMLTVRAGLASVAANLPAIIEGQVNLNGAVQAVVVSQGSAEPDLAVVASVSNGGLIKLGAGTLVLSGANSFDGGLLTESGVLGVGHDRALGTGPIKLGAGRIRAEGGPRTLTNLVLVGCWACQPGDPSDPTFSGSKDLMFTGPARLGGIPVWTVENTGRTVFAGSIGEDEPGRGFLKEGSGPLQFTGAAANTYSGPTSVRAGMLVLGKGAGVNAVPGSLDIGGAGVLAIVQLAADEQIPDTNRILIRSGGRLDLDGFVETGALDLAGGNLITGTGRFILSRDLNTLAGVTPGQIDGTLDLGGAMRILNVGEYEPEVDLWVSARIVNGLLYKTGTGQLLLSGANEFTGGLVLLSGSLGLGHDLALGTGPFYVSGSSISIHAETSTRTLANPVYLHANLTVNGSHDLVLAGEVGLLGKTTLLVANPRIALGAIREVGGSFELIKTGPGTLDLMGSNSFTRGLVIDGGMADLRHEWAAGRGLLLVNGGGITLGGTVETVRAGPTLISSNAVFRARLGSPRLDPLLRVFGGLALGGRVDVESGAGFGPGIYELIEYTGGFSAAVSLGTVPEGFNLRLVTTEPGRVSLVVEPLLELTCPADVMVQCFEEIPAPDLNSLTVQGECGELGIATSNDQYSTNGTAVIVRRTYEVFYLCGVSDMCTQTLTATRGNPAPPTLELHLDADEVVLCWSQACPPEFQLQETTDLNTPISWTPSQALITTEGVTHCARLPATGHRFFRLQQLQPQLQ